jgi:hypothetical protein
MFGNPAVSYKIIDNDHERIGRWMDEQNACHWVKGNKCIGLEKDGELIAGVMYEGFNGASIQAHVAVKDRLTREFLWFIFYYPFEQLKANVIIGLVPEFNKKSHKFVEHLGFIVTARIPKAHPSGCLLIYTMYKHQCQWLRIKNGIKIKSTARA